MIQDPDENELDNYYSMSIAETIEDVILPTLIDNSDDEDDVDEYNSRSTETIPTIRIPFGKHLSPRQFSRSIAERTIGGVVNIVNNKYGNL